MFTKEVIELAKPCVEAIKKISKAKGKEWKWKPEVGEWCLWKKHPHLVLEPEGQDNWFTIYADKVDKMDYDEPYYYRLVVPIKRCIPFLHWEKLEKIMEGLGYELRLDKRGDPPNVAFDAGLGKIGEPIFASQLIQAPTRQEAVMRAIIRLGEGIEKNE